ncbi:amidophosphoribosyltransferase [Nitrospira sp.]|nr:amidophosphoribosyltransferase [Nitrospira sp.]
MRSLGTLDHLRILMRRLSYTVLPGTCVGCQALLSDNQTPFFCDSCWEAIKPLSGPACLRCGRPFASAIALLYSPTHICGPCRMVKPAYRRAFSLYAYEPPLREAIHAFKYRKNLAIGETLECLFVHALPRDVEVDLVIPVPLAPDRLRDREYNQSLRLAQAAARVLHTPMDYGHLQRRSGGTPQTSLPRQARLLNLRRSFTVHAAEALQGRRILLIDDVLTTGTTVNECAKALRRAGSGDITVVTLARTLSD